MYVVIVTVRHPAISPDGMAFVRCVESNVGQYERSLDNNGNEKKYIFVSRLFQ
jgi:hypothetical protein